MLSDCQKHFFHILGQTVATGCEHEIRLPLKTKVIHVIRHLSVVVIYLEYDKMLLTSIPTEDRPTRFVI